MTTNATSAPVIGFDPVWERLFASRAWGKYPPESVIQAIMRAYGKREDRRAIRILDLGCGPGANTWFLAREGFSVAGIDGSPSAIQQNRARLGSEGLDADLRVGDFTRDLPWPAASFDAVLDNASVCANPEPDMRLAFADAARVLKPGGRLISLAFTDRTWGYGGGRPGPCAGSFVDIDEGPLAGKGLVQFIGRGDIDRLYADFAPLSVERTSYTLEGGQRLVELWVVQGVKRA